jgi:hypothetical protein
MALKTEVGVESDTLIQQNAEMQYYDDNKVKEDEMGERYAYKVLRGKPE